MPRMKRWKPTPEAMRIIRKLAIRVADHGNPRIEIASREARDLNCIERGMDLSAISSRETDLDDRYRISVLRSGKLLGRMSMTPLVELWVSTTEELKDQMYVQFDACGDIEWVRLTWQSGMAAYKKGDSL